MRVNEEDPGPAGDDAHAPHTRPTPKIAATTTPPLTCRQRAGTRGCCPPPHTQAKRHLIHTPAPDRTIGSYPCVERVRFAIVRGGNRSADGQRWPGAVR